MPTATDVSVVLHGLFASPDMSAEVVLSVRFILTTASEGWLVAMLACAVALEILLQTEGHATNAALVGPTRPGLGNSIISSA